MTAKHHEIEIARNGNEVFPVNPMPDMAVDDTLRYFCNSEGQLSIVFPDLSPFEPDETKKNSRVPGGKKLTALRSGRFQSGCRFKPNGEREIGWPEGPGSGADVVIRN